MQKKNQELYVVLKIKTPGPLDQVGEAVEICRGECGALQISELYNSDDNKHTYFARHVLEYAEMLRETSEVV